MNTILPLQVNNRMIGITLVLIAASLWGISGTVAQYLFQLNGFTAEWLVVVRLQIAGFLMLLLAYRKQKSRIWHVWKMNQTRNQLILFSLIGMLGVQYTYFAAIEESNAATATVLQYLGPVFIAIYIVVKEKRVPTSRELFIIFLALLGTFLLVTNGQLTSLSLSIWGVFWGIASGVALAFYTLQPYTLIKNYGTMIVVGWGMFIGGLGFSLFFHPWNISGELNAMTLMAIFFVIIFGTLIPFYCYLESLQFLSASETSILSCAEPLSAAIIAVVWLQVSLGIMQWIGTLFILLTIIFLSKQGKKGKEMNR
ncbi:DMT family transporter [Bacillus salitolerans]|uniref:DMT family transporter n=1 Tax=Bacillus salitolerans TaxID=1437434 RepID=A0ABW4LR03_9BACI